MIYHLILALYFLPRFFYERVFLHKKRSFLWQRLGLRPYPDLQSKKKPIIWLHAVSVGETKAAGFFLRQLRREYPQATIIISSVTETGHEEAKRSVKEADLHLFLPFDFSFSIRKALSQFPIDLLIFVETDLWYNFINLAKKQGAKVFLISGKMSERSCKNYRLFFFYSKRLFALFDQIFCQNNVFKERFIAAGAPIEKLLVTGNLKFDLSPSTISDEEKERWREKFSSTPSLFMTVASTHPKEEEGILDSLSKLLQERKDIHIFLAPRHPERFSSVADLLKKNGLSFTSLSQLERDKQIILIDRLGFLPICYSLSQLAIVGGSFVEKIGGHNILEPVTYHVPVYFGPYMSAQQEMVQYVLNQNCGYQTSLADLSTSILHFFNEKSLQEKLSKNCFSLVRSSECANKTLLALKRFL